MTDAAMTPKTFQKRILDWYHVHGRKDLPWQKNPTPYRVWVSEIMLQQTQVQTVIPYYLRFIKTFPSLKSLAHAQLDDVLHLWTGLGYYARARNLHKAAQTIMTEHGGHFPTQLEEVIALPGIGRSTAGAILSFAKKQPISILDGNIKRVISRYFGIAGWPGMQKVQERLWNLANQYTPSTHTDAYNQAMMDLGATLCTRVKPRCNDCPIHKACYAHSHACTHTLPSPKPKRDKPTRATHMLMLMDEHNSLMLEKRPKTGIWGGLWGFKEFNDVSALKQWCQSMLKTTQLNHKPLPDFRHTFSHYHLQIHPHLVEVKSRPQSLPIEENETIWYNLEQPKEVGLAAPVKRLIEKLAQ